MKLPLLSTLVLVLVPVAFGVPLYRNGNASKPYASVRTPQDYDTPVNGIVPPNPRKGMSLFSDKAGLPNPKNIWMIDSGAFTGNLRAVNDKGTHWALTLTKATEIGQLLNDINNTPGWVKL